jgi:flavin-dependent dehydrogenase
MSEVIASEWDAIVCGASFGGLAAASQLGGRVLLIDSGEIGDGETSASAVPVACLENLDLMHTAEQLHDEIIVHTAHHAQVLDFFPYATFDYRSFCRAFFEHSDAHFLKARVRSASDGVVTTSTETFEAPIVIDATGWRTAAEKSKKKRVRAARKSFGLESRQPYVGEGLHFYVGGGRRNRRFYWAFPAGDHVRAGLATYSGESSLSPDLNEFLDDLDLGTPGHTHGGYFTSRLGEPIRDGAFIVGDAAGHCLPVTGEGIRPALVFGQVAGRLAERARQGELTLPEALSRYRAYIRSRARGYRILDRLQVVLGRLPDPLFEGFGRYVATDRFQPWARRAYWNVADPDLLTAEASSEPLPKEAATSSPAIDPPVRA